MEDGAPGKSEVPSAEVPSYRALTLVTSGHIYNIGPSFVKHRGSQPAPGEEPRQTSPRAARWGPLCLGSGGTHHALVGLLA